MKCYPSLTKGNLKLSLIAVAITASLTGCKLPNYSTDKSTPSIDESSPNLNEPTPSRYLENYRPQLQYSPENNFMNDPNGLVYYDGEYHLFYQHNPNGNDWGDMSWGHAVSIDQVHWQELPIALPVRKANNGDVIEMIFSGSAVVDTKNTSGFGSVENPAMVAMFTSLYPSGTTLDNGKFVKGGTQAQSIAYSLDKGRTFVFYAGNPIIPLPPAGYEDQYKDFRDPKVFWYEPEQKWVMTAVLSWKHKAVLYSSKNLKDWTYMSEFSPENVTGGVWECPDLFEMDVDGDVTNKKWVFVVNLNPGGPAGGSGSQHYIGEFDGEKFIADPDSVFDNTPTTGSVIEDFEGAATGWTGSKDLDGTFIAVASDEQSSQGYKILDTFVDGDNGIGVITSPTFTINNKYINLMVGGGSHPRDPEAVLEAIAPTGEVLFSGSDFEGEADATYENLGWIATGDLIGQKVATITMPGQQEVAGFTGSGFANTFFGELLKPKVGGDVPMGTLISPAFTITKNYINFSISGGNHPYGKEGATAALLIIDGEVVKSETGSNSEQLNWAYWDVSAYQGKSANIKLIDENNGGWGHINVDHFIASDEAASPLSYETTVNLLVDGEVVQSATGQGTGRLSWHSWDVYAFNGKDAQIRVIDNNHGDWGHLMIDHIMQSDTPKKIANWSDFGADFYAAVSWNGMPDDKRLWIGWMSNWSYAGAVPTTPWRSSQTFIRELALKTIDGKVKLTQKPVDNMALLRETPLFKLEETAFLEGGETLLADKNITAQVFEIETDITPSTATNVGFKVRSGSNGDVTIVGYDVLAGEVYLDRRNSGDSSFNSSFAAKHSAPVVLTNGKLKLHIIVDTASVTVFAGEGEVVITDLILPEPSSTGIEVFTEGGSASLESLTVWPLTSIWADK
ncbi:MAG: fructan beta-fructosidase [Oleiphilaceae bacterium]|jgi:fructan beta-fructosidase